MFLLVSSSVRSKQPLCFVHGQGQKREQKPTTKKDVGFHNHSPLLTMLDAATRPYYINHSSYTVNAFRVQVENGLEDVFFLCFSLVSIQFDIS